jgi:hypothetical protein
MRMTAKEKFLWVTGGAFLALTLSIAIGGIYTITPPSGPEDVAYKINRLTGEVWLIKTYAKQAGQIRVRVARQADVETATEIIGTTIPTVVMTEVNLPTYVGRD